MLKMLIVNGQDDSEAGEAELLATLATASGKIEVTTTSSLESFLTQRWDIVWFCTHLTRWRSAGYSSLEKRSGSAFRRICIYEQVLQQVQATLVVVSACNSFIKKPKQVAAFVSYQGDLPLDDALLFTAAFFPRLLRALTRRTKHLSNQHVVNAFRTTKRLLTNTKHWSLHCSSQNSKS